jgi:hypothetical protein
VFSKQPTEHETDLQMDTLSLSLQADHQKAIINRKGILGLRLDSGISHQQLHQQQICNLMYLDFLENE